jgi:hypothetical protein
MFYSDDDQHDFRKSLDALVVDAKIPRVEQIRELLWLAEELAKAEVEAHTHAGSTLRPMHEPDLVSLARKVHNVLEKGQHARPAGS